MKFSNLLPDLSLPQPLLPEIFQQQHKHHLELYTNWSLAATRRKLMGSYWLKVLLNNYCFLILAGSVIVIFLNQNQPVKQLLIGMAPAYLIVFAVLFLTMYFPLYQLDFLPHLDNCVEAYKGKQLEGIQECKKQQYSVITLMLIQNIYRQLAGMEPVMINTTNSQLLARQYGISVKSVGSALQLILRGDWDRKSIRKRTEILDDFEAAKEHFRKLSSDKAVLLLDRLEKRILQAPPK
jgi:hypothetical protein